MCGILWRKNLFEYLDGGQFEWDGSRNCWVNVLNWVMLTGKRNLLVFNTHLESGLGQLEKQQNSKMLRHAIGKILKQFEGVPFILGGDFNTDKSGISAEDIVLENNKIHHTPGEANSINTRSPPPERKLRGAPVRCRTANLPESASCSPTGQFFRGRGRDPWASRGPVFYSAPVPP